MIATRTRPILVRPARLWPLEKRTGVGPYRVDAACPACKTPIATTGVCKCS